MRNSSTAAREAIARGRPAADLVGQDVARYIAHHHLYAEEDAAAH
jgi:nicotinic acid mononucleotide adenylyltransferase